MPSPDNHIEKWSLNSPELIAETATASIYQVEQNETPVILKVFTEVGKKDESAGSEYLSLINGNGSVKILTFDESAQLLEKLSGQDLLEFSKRREEDKATSVFIDIIKQLHSVSIPENCELRELASLVLPLMTVDFPAELESHRIKALDLASKLLESSKSEVLLHGDLHHENVLKNSENKYVCFDPKGLRGDPSYELATTLKNPWGVPDISHNLDLFQKRAEQFSSSLNLPKDRIIGFAYVHFALSLAWALQDNNDTSHQAALLRMTEHLV